MTATSDARRLPVISGNVLGGPDVQDTAAFARSVGAMVRAARNERNWTLAETGELVGLSVSVLCRVELGVRPLDMSRFAGLCMALEVPPAAMIEQAQFDAFPLGWRGLW